MVRCILSICIALVAVIAITCIINGRNVRSTELPKLTTEEMMLNVGSACCTDVNTLEKTYCQTSTPDECANASAPACRGTDWIDDCAAENGKKASGSGSKTIHEQNCGKYEHGDCKLIPETGDCLNGVKHESSPSSCGTKWLEESC